VTALPPGGAGTTPIEPPLEPRIGRRIEPPVLTDGVVTLRAWQAGDLAATLAACNDPVLAAWLPIPQPYTEEAGRYWLDVLAPEHWAAQERLPLAVAGPAGLLGGLTVRLRERQHGIAEVSYWVAARARGAGVAVRATLLAARWAFADLGVHRLELLADVRNTASQRVAEKAGFTREGVLRSARELWGERHDMVLFALLPADLGPAPRGGAGDD
jgi:RimJ/RimL family protein N-acetyltransferase